MGDWLVWFALENDLVSCRGAGRSGENGRPVLSEQFNIIHTGEIVIPEKRKNDRAS